MIRVLRTLQTYAPAVRPLKFGFYNALTRYLGWHVEIEFKLLSRMRGAGLALDIGGNWGQSIWALKGAAAPRKIVSFEPNPALSSRLQRVFARDPGVQIEACGLGDRAGGFTLYVPRYRNFVYDGLASLDEGEARNWLNAYRMARFDPKKLHVDEYQTPVRTLDSYGFEPDIVKIDVQGLELQVVRGGLQTFSRCHPVTIVETPEPALVKLFETLDMAPYRWTGSQLIRGDVSGINVLFLHADRLKQLGLPG